jgi:hypothetical protein
MPAFDAQYAAWRIRGILAAIEAIATIEPRWRATMRCA